MMLISSLTTVIAAGAVFGVIGYRVFKSAEAPPSAPVAAPQPPEPPAPPPPPQVPLEATLTLPKDAKIVYTAVAEDLLVLSLEINGTIEIRTYDLKTLKPAGRMSFGEVP